MIILNIHAEKWEGFIRVFAALATAITRTFPTVHPFATRGGLRHTPGALSRNGFGSQECSGMAKPPVSEREFCERVLAVLRARYHHRQREGHFRRRRMFSDVYSDMIILNIHAVKRVGIHRVFAHWPEAETRICLPTDPIIHRWGLRHALGALGRISDSGPVSGRARRLRKPFWIIAEPP